MVVYDSQESGSFGCQEAILNLPLAYTSSFGHVSPAILVECEFPFFYLLVNRIFQKSKHHVWVSCNVNCGFLKNLYPKSLKFLVPLGKPEQMPFSPGSAARNPNLRYNTMQPETLGEAIAYLDLEGLGGLVV